MRIFANDHDDKNNIDKESISNNTIKNFGYYNENNENRYIDNYDKTINKRDIKNRNEYNDQNNEKPVRAKRKFQYFLKKLDKVKKASGQILACHEIFEKDPSKVKTFEIDCIIICIKKKEALL